MEMPADRSIERPLDGPKLLTAGVDVLCHGVLVLVNQILRDIL